MKILNPPIKITSQIIIFLFECTKRNKGCSAKEILDYIGKTERYILGAVEFLAVNEVVIKKEKEYFISNKILDKFEANEDSAKKVIKSILINNKLFEIGRASCRERE